MILLVLKWNESQIVYLGSNRLIYRGGGEDYPGSDFCSSFLHNEQILSVQWKKLVSLYKAMEKHKALFFRTNQTYLT